MEEMECDIAETIGSEILGAVYDIGKDTAKALPTHRQCNVDITNECRNYTLCNLSVHTEIGRCLVPFPAIIQPSATGEAKFAKRPSTVRGSAGVFTFDLLNNSTKQSTEKIAVMYKVPFNLKAKSNAYALGVFDISTKCDGKLFRKMSKDTNASFIRGLAKGPSITYRSDAVTIAATMSDCSTPTMKVQVMDT